MKFLWLFLRAVPVACLEEINELSKTSSQVSSQSKEQESLIIKHLNTYEAKIRK
ncbi:hypothetical protein SK128_024234, partial [Halocaridina rubra]